MSMMPLQSGLGTRPHHGYGLAAMARLAPPNPLSQPRPQGVPATAAGVSQAAGAQAGQHGAPQPQGVLDGANPLVDSAAPPKSFAPKVANLLQKCAKPVTMGVPSARVGKISVGKSARPKPPSVKMGRDLAEFALKCRVPNVKLGGMMDSPTLDANMIGPPNSIAPVSPVEPPHPQLGDPMSQSAAGQGMDPTQGGMQAQAPPPMGQPAPPAAMGAGAIPPQMGMPSAIMPGMEQGAPNSVSAGNSSGLAMLDPAQGLPDAIDPMEVQANLILQNEKRSERLGQPDGRRTAKWRSEGEEAFNLSHYSRKGSDHLEETKKGPFFKSSRWRSLSPLGQGFFSRLLASGCDSHQIKQALVSLHDSVTEPVYEQLSADMAKLAGIGDFLNTKLPTMFDEGHAIAKHIPLIGGAMERGLSAVEPYAAKIPLPGLARGVTPGQIGAGLGMAAVPAAGSALMSRLPQAAEAAQPITQFGAQAASRFNPLPAAKQMGQAFMNHPMINNPVSHAIGRTAGGAWGGNVAGQGIDEFGQQSGLYDSQGMGEQVGTALGAGFGLGKPLMGGALANPLVRKGLGVGGAALGYGGGAAGAAVGNVADNMMVSQGNRLAQAGGFKDLASGLQAMRGMNDPQQQAAMVHNMLQSPEVKTELGHSLLGMLGIAPEQAHGYVEQMKSLVQQGGEGLTGVSHVADGLLGHIFGVNAVAAMPAMQKISIVLGSLMALLGLATGSPMLGGLGTVAALGGAAPEFMRHMQGPQGAPQPPQPSGYDQAAQGAQQMAQQAMKQGSLNMFAKSAWNPLTALQNRMDTAEANAVKANGGQPLKPVNLALPTFGMPAGAAAGAARLGGGLLGAGGRAIGMAEHGLEIGEKVHGAAELAHQGLHSLHGMFGGDEGGGGTPVRPGASFGAGLANQYGNSFGGQLSPTGRPMSSTPQPSPPMGGGAPLGGGGGLGGSMPSLSMGGSSSPAGPTTAPSTGASVSSAAPSSSPGGMSKSGFRSFAKQALGPPGSLASAAPKPMGQSSPMPGAAPSAPGPSKQGSLNRFAKQADDLVSSIRANQRQLQSSRAVQGVLGSPPPQQDLVSSIRANQSQLQSARAVQGVLGSSGLSPTGRPMSSTPQPAPMGGASMPSGGLGGGMPSLPMGGGPSPAGSAAALSAAPSMPSAPASGSSMSKSGFRSFAKQAMPPMIPPTSSGTGASVSSAPKMPGMSSSGMGGQSPGQAFGAGITNMMNGPGGSVMPPQVPPTTASRTGASVSSMPGVPNRSVAAGGPPGMANAQPQSAPAPPAARQPVSAQRPVGMAGPSPASQFISETAGRGPGSPYMLGQLNGQYGPGGRPEPSSELTGAMGAMAQGGLGHTQAYPATPGRAPVVAQQPSPRAAGPGRLAQNPWGTAADPSQSAFAGAPRRSKLPQDPWAGGQVGQSAFTGATPGQEFPRSPVTAARPQGSGTGSAPPSQALASIPDSSPSSVPSLDDGHTLYPPMGGLMSKPRSVPGQPAPPAPVVSTGPAPRGANQSHFNQFAKADALGQNPQSIPGTAGGASPFADQFNQAFAGHQRPSQQASTPADPNGPRSAPWDNQGNPLDNKALRFNNSLAAPHAGAPMSSFGTGSPYDSNRPMSAQSTGSLISQDHMRHGMPGMRGLTATPDQRQITAPMQGPIDFNQPLRSPAQTAAMTASNTAAQQLPGMGQFNTAVGPDGILHAQGRNPSPAVQNMAKAPTSFGFDGPQVHSDYSLLHGHERGARPGSGYAGGQAMASMGRQPPPAPQEPGSGGMFNRSRDQGVLPQQRGHIADPGAGHLFHSSGPPVPPMPAGNPTVPGPTQHPLHGADPFGRLQTQAAPAGVGRGVGLGGQPGPAQTADQQGATAGPGEGPGFMSNLKGNFSRLARSVAPGIMDSWNRPSAPAAGRDLDYREQAHQTWAGTPGGLEQGQVPDRPASAGDVPGPGAVLMNDARRLGGAAM